MDRSLALIDQRRKDMQARIFPVFLVLAMVVALVVGGAIGYVVKPPSLVSGPTRYVMVIATSPTSTTSDSCEFHSGHKAC
jgi:predicted permease